MFNLQKTASPVAIRSRRHTDKPLTNILLSYDQTDDAFIADKVFRTVGVSKSTDFFYEIPLGEMNRLHMQKRARGAAPAIAGFDYNKIAFLLEIYALMTGQTDEDDVDMDEILDWDMDATNFLWTQSKLRREKSFNDGFFKAGVWQHDYAGVTGTPTSVQFKKWSDDASTPIKDVKRARKDVLRRTGKLLNTMTIDWDTKDVLLEHPEIVDRVDHGQTTGPAKVTMDHLKSLFEMDEIHVGYAVENSANEGAAEIDNDFVMNNGCLLTHTPARPGKRVAASGYNFVWKVYSENGMRMRKHRADLELTDFKIIDDAYAQKQVSAELGVFFADTGTL